MRRNTARSLFFTAIIFSLLSGPLSRLAAEDDVVVISGTVTDGAGLALPGLTVKAYEKTLRSATLLAGTKTDKRGGFELRLHSEKTDLTIIVKVFGAKNELLYTSPDYHAGAGLEKLRIVIKRGRIIEKKPSSAN